MTSIGGQTPTYDANGNVTNDYLNSYTSWDQFGRPTAANGVGVTYDALGRAVELNKSGTYNQIQYSPTGFKMQLLNGSVWVKAFVPMPAGTAEVWTPTANYYRHSDWLGSSRLASLTSGSSRVYYDGAYGPFGEPYAQSGTSDLSFTGMNQDISSNVYDFAAREYGIQGRWPSPDPAGLAAVDITNPQTWNQYCYVGNGPDAFIDPTGTCAFNIAVSGGGLLSSVQMNALQNAFAQVFATGGVGVNFNFSGSPDYTFSVVPSGTPLAYQLNGTPVTAPPGSGGVDAGFIPGQNYGFGFFDQAMSTYSSVSIASSAFGAIFGRAGAHEAGHYFLHTNDNPPTLSGLGGIMDGRLNALNPKLSFSQGQAIQLQYRCQKLHPPAPSSPSGGGGGGGPAGSSLGGGDGDSGFGGVDQGGGGDYVYWCVSGPIGGQCGWSRVD